jgi:hypothetical protein
MAVGDMSSALMELLDRAKIEQVDILPQEFAFQKMETQCQERTRPQMPEQIRWCVSGKLCRDPGQHTSETSEAAIPHAGHVCHLYPGS